MGGLSNQLLVVTILSYVLAMLAYAVEYAFGARSLVGQRVLVGAGGPSVSEKSDLSDLSDGATGNRYVAKFWDASLPPGEAAERCLEAPALRRTT